MKKLIINEKEYSSRLILGTGKYKDFEQTAAAVKAKLQKTHIKIANLNVF